jgi:phosphoribosylformimino-5-aminoimidazole carboxamide ribotide isomerase
MRIIGVLDLLGGRAVHARAGHRDRYAPVSAVAGAAIESGDAVALARAYVDRLGVTEIYIADLDAITHRAPQDSLVRRVSALGARCWLDQGVSSVDEARHAHALGATQIVVGLETLPSFDVLTSICTDAGRDRVAFSLDLRDGQPMTASPAIATRTAEELVVQAVDAGVGTVIVLDLARVGAGSGLDLDLLARVSTAAPSVQLLAGGGVRGLEDVRQLQTAGCHGALVATALLDGRLTAEEIRTLYLPSTENASSTLPGMKPSEL